MFEALTQIGLPIALILIMAGVGAGPDAGRLLAGFP